jgi:hypothetical protein
MFSIVFIVISLLIVMTTAVQDTFLTSLNKTLDSAIIEQLEIATKTIDVAMYKCKNEVIEQQLRKNLKVIVVVSVL